MRRVLYLFSIISKNPLTQSNHEKYIKQTKTGRTSYKYFTSTPPNYQSHEKYGVTEKLTEIRGDWREMMNKCNGVHPGLDLGAEKGH